LPREIGNDPDDLYFVDGKSALQKVGATGIGSFLQLGRERFDTKLVRNLTFIANLQRILALVIRREIEKADGKLRIGSNVISQEATEIFGSAYRDNYDRKARRIQ